jgi:DNA polymerase-3 subunit delta'
MNWEMLGHEWAVRLLSEHIAHDRLRQAYLLTGPGGIGRRTLALHLAQALNCPQPTAPGQPCGVCRTCTRILAMQHPDLFVVQREPDRTELRIELIRELQRSLSLAPFEAQYRVALLLNFEEASLSAANALLKTLEEPFPHVVLVLTADNVESLLPTIVSRCEVLRLNPLPLDMVEDGLHSRWGVPAEQARLLAHLSGGRPGYALQLAENPDLLEQRKIWLNNHHELLSASRVDRFAFVEAQTKDRDKEALHQQIQVWLSYWRDLLLLTTGSTSALTNLDRLEELTNLASRLDLPTAHRAVSALERTLTLLDRNANSRLALEVLLLDLPMLASA